MKKSIAMILAAAAILGAPERARAEALISAQVDKTAVGMNEQIVLEVTVSGNHPSMPDPQMPPLSNFSVYSSGRNQSISFINGAVSSTIIFTYVLVPHFVGKGVIGPISITIEGKTAKTDPIEIQVQGSGTAAAAARPSASPGGRAPAAVSARAPDVFVSAEIDKKKPYVNEQVTLTVKFYTSVSLLGNPQYNAPKISGFISEDLPPERHGNTTLHGRPYYYSEIKTALFPAEAGKLTIGPASVKCQVQRDMAIEPSADFFERFFSQGMVAAQTKELNSDPVIISAEPLPSAGKPADFSGAVGSYSIAAAVDRSKAKVGDAINLTVTVSGSGNLRSIEAPKVPAVPSLRVYDTVSSLNLDKKNDLVNGSRVFKTVIVPRVSGPIAIPAIPFSYFDPARKTYLRASTLPIALAIAPGEGGTVAAGPAAAAPAAPQGITSVNEDIRYLKAKPDGSPVSRLLAAAASAGPVHGVPFLLLAGTFVFAQIKESGAADRRGSRFKSALRAANARLRQAEKLEAKDPKRVALLSDALSHFIADKLDMSASGLTWRMAQDMLKARQPNLSEEKLSRLKELWDELDLFRFAPTQVRAGDLDKASSAMARIFTELDREIKKA